MTFDFRALDSSRGGSMFDRERIHGHEAAHRKHAQLKK